jgi:N-acetylmuramoyl-L-alanine amidase
LKTRSSQRRLRWGALLLLVALPSMPGYARPRSNSHRSSANHGESWAREHFATAERMREALNGRPPADRSRRDYQRVINSYRSVYFGAPTSSKADPSVVAVAETLVEMGRRFDDDKILNQAIAQYKFLRKEYPGSKYRCDALFTIGEIYNDDLNDPEQARATFKEFLHRYPHNRLVEDAQQAIAQLDRDAEKEQKAEADKKPGKGSGDRAADKARNTTAKNATEKGAVSEDARSDDASNVQTAERESKPQSGHLPRVTGIRHWSTPDYTRVAIDVESDVKFGSQRIANPDRIFFDLHDTKLASTLVGKSFDVDDGFLKKIRVAQFQQGRTRVVLEVDSLSDYDAFLLPNPYRLIIDVHGKDIRGKGDAAVRRNSAKDAMTATATADVEAGPRTGSRPEVSNADVPKTEVAKNVPKSELKADMKALAGEPVSKKEQLHEQPNAKGEDGDNDASGDANSREALVDTADKPIKPSDGPRPNKAKTREVEVKTATGTIKKVIVDADDDDSEPADTAKVETAKVENAKTRPSAAVSPKANKSKVGDTKTADATDDGASAKETNGADSDESVADDEKASDGAPMDQGKGSPNSAHRGSVSSHLGSSHTSGDFATREARPTASGDRSLIRALGLKIGKIVIDPGHGGHDTGTIGPNGLQEKDLVLEVGRRLGKLLETRLGAQVVYTRKDDTFIPLETRTAIANQQRADLFVSIHANSSHDPDARGVETYYLNFTSSPEALEVAARENAVSETSVYQLQDLVKKIALKEKIEESREFAGDVQESLHSGLAAKSPAIRDRGVKKAPFIVLIGANMPSILAEISFVSNPTDEHRLETSEYRQRIAESLYHGIAKYVDGLSGVKVASNKEKAAGQ